MQKYDSEQNAHFAKVVSSRFCNFFNGQNFKAAFLCLLPRTIPEDTAANLATKIQLMDESQL